MTAAPPDTLTALADTFVPAVERDGEPEVRALFARSARDLGLPGLLAELAGPRYEPLVAELDAARLRRRSTSTSARGRCTSSRAGATERQLLRELKGAVLSLFYALPDEAGRNPNWPALGYPGPTSEPPPAAEAPKSTRPSSGLPGPGRRCAPTSASIGSGAGGGVIAAELAARRPLA